MKGNKGFTLVELMVVVAVIGILTAIAIPIFADATSRSRVAKAQADVRALATAISAYSAHMSDFPANLSTLTAVATNDAGLTAGPFMASIPTPPSSAWGASYTYATGSNGTFTVSAVGEGTTVSAP